MDLKKYVEKYNINVSEFCRTKKINKNTFYRIMRKQGKTTIGTAKAIQKATFGEVTVEEIMRSQIEEIKKYIK